MRILRWAFAAGSALLVGLGFAVLSENLVLAVIPVAAILVLAGYLSLERKMLGPPTPGRKRRRRTGSVGSGATYAGATDGGSSTGGDCGFGGDGGGFGGDGGGGGGC